MGKGERGYKGERNKKKGNGKKKYNKGRRDPHTLTWLKERTEGKAKKK